MMVVVVVGIFQGRTQRILRQHRRCSLPKPEVREIWTWTWNRPATYFSSSDMFLLRATAAQFMGQKGGGKILPGSAKILHFASSQHHIMQIERGV